VKDLTQLLTLAVLSVGKVLQATKAGQIQG